MKKKMNKEYTLPYVFFLLSLGFRTLSPLPQHIEAPPNAEGKINHFMIIRHSSVLI